MAEATTVSTEKIREAIRVMVRENRGNERTHQWASILYDLVSVVEEQQRQIARLAFAGREGTQNGTDTRAVG